MSTSLSNKIATAGNRPAAEPAPEMMAVKEITRRLGITKSSWFAGITLGDYPFGVHVGRKARRWPREQIERIAREGIMPGSFSQENKERELVHEQRVAAWVTRAQARAKAQVTAAKKGVRHA